MNPLSHDTLYGNWATLLLATDKQGEIDFSRQSDEIDVCSSDHRERSTSPGKATK